MVKPVATDPKRDRGIGPQCGRREGREPMNHEDGFRLYQKAYRPKPEDAVSRDRRYRDPDEQAEYDVRVVDCAGQSKGEAGRQQTSPLPASSLARSVS
jgi:hypothetical protein